MEETTNLEVREADGDGIARESFDTLIRGRYKADFDAKVQKIIEGRLKALHRENEALRMEQSRRDAAAQRQRLQHREMMDTLLRQAVHYGAKRAGEDLSRSLSGGRIAENGGSGCAAAVSTVDPKRLTRQERLEIRRRVARGEKVKFN